MHHASASTMYLEVLPGDSNGVRFAFICDHLRFNRRFLVRWTALWVIMIPLLPAVAFYFKSSSMRKGLVFGSGGGRRLVCGNNSIRTKLAEQHTPARHTHSKSAGLILPRVHPCVSNWNRSVFLLKETELGCHSREHYFWLTGCASLQTDCPHGYACCHNTPGGSAKSIIV